jgi:hypothetical protein
MPHLHHDPGHHDFTTSAFIVRTDGPEPAVIKLATAADLRAMPAAEIVDQTRDTALFLLEHTLSEWQPYPTSAWPA